MQSAAFRSKRRFSADDRCRLYGCFHAKAKAAFRGVIPAPQRKEAERT
jgi:hypothetical protein